MKMLHKRTKLNTKGFGHIEILIAIVVLVGIVGAGVFVYNRHNKAHAGTFTHLGSAMGVDAWACKTYINAYGGVYSVTAQWTKSPSTFAHAYVLEVDSKVGSTQISVVQNTAYYANVVAQEKAFVSVPLQQTASLEIAGPASSWFFIGPGTSIPWSSIANC